ncbi:putative enzyme related to lactoylglutathione lyase [Parabacteroides sp. PFB2-10]|uniref:VOC family protein n=1 Tax=Parabacteroides sp. PFB2-10 TaxID=1742405 RepID=UPI00247616ED|nr:VOC family protein [Parabacteroides sp. PFB2-10]MDH6313476.1 putative enzyme related to lactoylglutathione lyase [Parabacteroides sp. PFB2-10]MDL2241888.1 VOC family protein [Bacteroidales bacterium OttesenSCG-928-L03]MDL2245929.1 VOC family protein [Parabacteroides sp. OttesenSCG-928-J18]
MKTLVAFFEIPAADFERAVKFYETVFSVKLASMDCGHEKMAFFPEENGLCPGAISWSSAFNFKPSDQGVLLSLNIESMEAAIQSVEKGGGRILISKTKIEAENRGYFSVFIDSEGNRVGLYSDK